MTFATADIFDADPDASRVCELALRDYGGRRTFCGPAVTLRVRDDHRAGIALCQRAGEGRVLVIDGGGSLHTALFGGTMAGLARRNGWAGVIAFGAIRDAGELAECDLGVKALCATPRSAATPQPFEQDVPVHFGGVTFRPGEWVYADADGVIVRNSMYSLQSVKPY